MEERESEGIDERMTPKPKADWARTYAMAYEQSIQGLGGESEPEITGFALKEGRDYSDLNSLLHQLCNRPEVQKGESKKVGPLQVNVRDRLKQSLTVRAGCATGSITDQHLDRIVLMVRDLPRTATIEDWLRITQEVVPSAGTETKGIDYSDLNSLLAQLLSTQQQGGN